MENYFGIKGYVNLSVFNNPEGSADQTRLVTQSFFLLFAYLSPGGHTMLERKSSTNPSVSSGGVTFTKSLFFFLMKGEMFCAHF